MSSLESPNSPYSRTGTILDDLHRIKLLSEEFVRDASNPSTILTSQVNMYANRYAAMLTEGTKSICPVSSNTWSFYLASIYADVQRWYLENGGKLITSVTNIVATGEGLQDPSKDLTDLYITWKDDLTNYKNADTINSVMKVVDLAAPQISKNAVVITNDVDDKRAALNLATRRLTSDTLVRDGLNDLGNTSYPSMESWMVTTGVTNTGNAMVVSDRSIVTLNASTLYNGSNVEYDRLTAVARSNANPPVAVTFDWFTAAVSMTVTVEISIPSVVSVLDLTPAIAVTTPAVAGISQLDELEMQNNGVTYYQLKIGNNNVPRVMKSTKNVSVHTLELTAGNSVSLVITPTQNNVFACRCTVTGVVVHTPVKVPLVNVIGSSSSAITYHTMIQNLEDELGVLKNYDTYMTTVGVSSIFTKFITEFNLASNPINNTANPAVQITMNSVKVWSIQSWFVDVSPESKPRLIVMFTRWANLITYLRRSMLMNLQYLRALAS